MKGMLLEGLNMETSRKNYYKTAAVLIIPIALQNLINVGISSVDVLMLGKVGEKVLSGAALGSQIQFILTLFLFGITSGAAVMGSQYYGKGDYQVIEKIYGLALRVSLIVTLLITCAAFFIPETLMSIFSNEAVVIAYGVTYLRWVCVSYVFMCFNMVYLNMLRSVGRVKIGTAVYFFSMLTNVVVNSILIFGLLGAPKLGIAGAAIGTVCARVVETVIILIYDKKRNTIFHFHPKILIEKTGELKKDFLKYALPVVCNEIMWGAGFTAITAILGHLGSPVVAANSVAQVVRNLATVVSFGVANAAGVMIGKVLGENRLDLAKMYGKETLKLCTITGIIGSCVVLSVRPILLQTMEISTQASSYLSMMLFVMAYFVFFQSINATLICGVFRSGGDTKFGLLIDSFFMWATSIGIGFFSAFVLKLDVTIVYVILMSDELLKIPFCLWRFNSYRWMKNVTR